MLKVLAEGSKDRLILRIPCKYEGQATKRYGETTIRFRIDEQYLAEAVKSVIGTDKPITAIIIHGKEKLPIGRTTFGGMRIDRTGESVLSLDTTAEDIRLPIERISGLADEEISLLLSIKVDSKGDS